MHVQPDDEVIVNRCLEGDQAAFAFLVNKYKEAVHAYAYHRVFDYQEAQDIVQEVFIKAYRKLAQLKWPHRFQSWLYTIASNECNTWLREHLKDREQEVHLEDVPAESLDELAVRVHSDEDIELTVKGAMETLPDDKQLALSLFYMSNLSIKEIAYFMGVSPNSVRIRLHRARKQLGERLEKMIGKKLEKEKLRSGFTFTVMNSIRGMPMPSLPNPRPIRWAPIPVSIGLALLIGIIGYGVSSGRDVSSEMPILKPSEATFEVSLLPEPDRQTILETEPENINNLVAADAGDPHQTQPTAGTELSGIVVRRVWEKAGSAIEVSPDGHYVSYINWSKGNLGVYDIETGKSRDLTDEGNGKVWDAVSIWSPDSKQIAYISYKESNTDLCTVGVDGFKPRVIYSMSPGSKWLWPWAWSPDGKHILASYYGEAETGEIENIVLVSVADGSISSLKLLGPGHSLIPGLSKGYKLPGFRDRASFMPTMKPSPDGRYVVYDSIQGDSLKRDIFLFAVNGGHEVTLVEHPADDFDPFWAPDGNRIVFTSRRSGSLGIWVLEVVDGTPKGSPQLISDNLNGTWPLGLTQDGSYYYGLSGRDNDIYFADLDPETGKVVKPPTKAVQAFEGLNSKPAFSADGKRLVYLSVRSGGPLVVRSLETGEERELQPDLHLSYLARFAPRWFPDGRSILIFAIYPDSAKEIRWGLHQIHVETGAVTHVVWDDEQGGICRRTPPVWSPDGSEMFFMRGRGNDTIIRIYDFETKQEWSLDFHSKLGMEYNKHNLAISPDGQQLAFIGCLKDGHSLQIIPTAGGVAREVIMLPKTSFFEKTGLVWTQDGRHLLYSRRKDEATELWRIPVEGGEPQYLGLTMKNIEHLSIQPDGRRIAFTGPGPRPGPEVWVIENFLLTSTASR